MSTGMGEVLDAVMRVRRPWMLGGSVGAMCYSEPRATLDVDCVLAVRPGHEDLIIAAFPEEEFYVPPRSVIAHELRRGQAGSFNVIHHASGFKADCYPSGDDDLMRWGLSQVRQLPVAGLVVPVAPPEYIIVMKLRFFAMSGQDKHLRDIRSLVRLQPTLDMELIRQWSAHYGLADAWRLVQSAAPG